MVAPKLQPSAGQLLLRETYEQVYQIFNHAGNQDPVRDLALMGFHPAEDSHTESLLYERIEQFGDKDVGKYFHMSLQEFLQLPRDITWKVIEECDRLAKKEATNATNVLSQMGGKQ